MLQVLPSLFVSHGSPMMPLEGGQGRDFLAGLGQQITADAQAPDAILVISAHWDTAVPTLTAATSLDTIHDFYGFPPELYRLNYPAKGAPELAERVAEMLGDAGLRAGLDHTRGLDHGAWVPLLLMWPQANIPVVQLSIQSKLGPGHHVQLGRALAPLRGRNVLILASGGLTHNLRALQRDLPENTGEPEWVRAFAQWVQAALEQGRSCDLVSYRAHAPFARENHPTDEHFLPLFVAMGAGGHGAAAHQLHSSTTLGALRLDAYAFS